MKKMVHRNAISMTKRSTRYNINHPICWAEEKTKVKSCNHSQRSEKYRGEAFAIFNAFFSENPTSADPSVPSDFVLLLSYLLL
jgi:hypothetical protein